MGMTWIRSRRADELPNQPGDQVSRTSVPLEMSDVINRPVEGSWEKVTLELRSGEDVETK